MAAINFYFVGEWHDATCEFAMNNIEELNLAPNINQ